MGIHNESGHTRFSPVPELSQLIPQLMDLLTSVTDSDRSFVPFKGKDNVVLLVNNLGSVSELELGGVVAEARKELDARGFTLSRILAGTFMVRSHRDQPRYSNLPSSVDEPQYAWLLHYFTFVANKG